MNKRPARVVILLFAGVMSGFLISCKNEDAKGTAGVRLYGNVEIRDASLAFNGAEHIAEVLVDEGDRVETGDRLATLITDRLETRLKQTEHRRDAQREILRRLENGSRPEEIGQARAELRAANARLENARLRVKRLQETSTARVTSQQELDDAAAQLEIESATVERLQQALALKIKGPREEDIAEARARLSEWNASLDGLRLELADAVLTAPAAGIVQSRVLEPGEYAAPERPVLTLALTAEKWIRAYVPEPDLGRIELGRKAFVSTDSFPGEKFEGQVGFLSPVAEFTPKTVQTTDLRPKLVYEVRIQVEDPDNRLRLGQPVTVDVVPEDRQ